MRVDEIRKVLVVGSGTVGQQIGLQCAVHGYDVVLYDVSDDVLNESLFCIKQFIGSLVKDGIIPEDQIDAILGRIKTTTDPVDAGKDADILSESVPEDPVLKNDIFKKFSTICPSRTIFTTNTSTLVPSMFSEATGRPALFAALHFHPFVWISNIVDIMPHPGTSQETIDLLYMFAKTIGQVPIVLKKESHQYIFNALNSSFTMTATTLAVNEIASYEDIDRAWMGVMGTAIGPFGILDLVGLKTVYDITSYWASILKDPQLEANANYIKRYVDKGHLGMKNGRGFYNYPDPAYSRKGFVGGDSV